MKFEGAEIETEYDLGAEHFYPHVFQSRNADMKFFLKARSKFMLSDLFQTCFAHSPKPIILIFGHFSMTPFRHYAPKIMEMYERYKDRAYFFMIYTKESHPNEEWVISKSGANHKYCIKQAETLRERKTTAQEFINCFDWKIPLFLDNMQNTCCETYLAHHMRIFFISTNNTIKFKTGLRVWNFKPTVIDEWMAKYLNNEPAAHTAVSKRHTVNLKNLDWSNFNLDSCLAVDAMRQDFKMFCVKEMSNENMDFYEEVESFQLETDFETKKTRVLEIYNKYLKPGAECCVNVSEELIEAIPGKYEMAQPDQMDSLDDIFEPCLDHVMFIMYDSFCRYLVSEDFACLKEGC